MSIAATTIVATVLAIAIFGSCPTIYADSAGVQTLQAESFSYSVAPLLAKRDVDRLDVRPDANGVIRLDVRNEALETHYIDQLELMEVRHRADELVLSGTARHTARRSHHRLSAGRRRAIALGGRPPVCSPPAMASGSRAPIPCSLSAAAGGAVEDFIDLTIPRVPGRDSLAVVLRARASLLTTEVLYDYMLSRPGRASRLAGTDLGRITSLSPVSPNGTPITSGCACRCSTARVGTRWCVSWISAPSPGATWRPSCRRSDLATAYAFGSSFTADEWRIDQATLAWDIRRTEPRTIGVARVTVPGSGSLTDAAAALRNVGDHPLATYPGQRFLADFDVGTSDRRGPFSSRRAGITPVDSPRWIDGRTTNNAFDPGGTTIQDVLRSWITTKDSLERRFFTARVPVL